MTFVNSYSTRTQVQTVIFYSKTGLKCLLFQEFWFTKNNLTQIRYDSVKNPLHTHKLIIINHIRQTKFESKIYILDLVFGLVNSINTYLRS